MDVWRITVAAIRRWYVLLPLLALTGYATMVVGDGVRPQYEVTATAILMPGRIPTEIPNPYGSMDQTTTALAIVLNNTVSRGHIAEMGLNPDYQVTSRTRSTIMDFTVLSDTAEESLATGDAVFELARQELEERQGEAGIPTRSQVGVQILQPPSVSSVVEDGKMRNMAIVGVLGAALSLLAAVLFDDIVGLFRRKARERRERRAAKREAERVEKPQPEVEEPADSVGGRAEDLDEERSDGQPSSSNDGDHGQASAAGSRRAESLAEARGDR